MKGRDTKQFETLRPDSACCRKVIQGWPTTTSAPAPPPRFQRPPSRLPWQRYGGHIYSRHDSATCLKPLPCNKRTEFLSLLHLRRYSHSKSSNFPSFSSYSLPCRPWMRTTAAPQTGGKLSTVLVWQPSRGVALHSDESPSYHQPGCSTRFQPPTTL